MRRERRSRSRWGNTTGQFLSCICDYVAQISISSAAVVVVIVVVSFAIATNADEVIAVREDALKRLPGRW